MKIFDKIIKTKQHNLKALTLSDLHIFDLKDCKKMEKIMDYLMTENYDVIYIVGDIIDSTNMISENFVAYENLLDFMVFLGSVAPTYIVYGSHDIGFYNFKGKSWTLDEQFFRDNFLNVIANFRGINILENEIKKIMDGFTVSGFNPSFKYVYSNPDGDTSVLLEEGGYEFLNKLNPSDTNTFLCHYPNAIEDLANNGYLNNVDLAIAGHNHNGMTQLKFLPVEQLLNFIHQNNRGLITPGKNINLDITKNLRGDLKLNERCDLVINPAVTSLAACTGILRNFEGMFYTGATNINYIPEEEMKLQRKKLDN